MDRDYVIRYVNWVAPGLTREGVVGSKAFALIPPDFVESARSAFDRTLQEGVPSRFEMMYAAEGGVIVWSVHVGPIFHEGRIIGAFTINTDVTSERRDFLDRDRFFSLSLDMLVVASSKGILKRVNPAFSEVLGYSMSELVGKPFLDFIHPSDIASTNKAFSRVLEGIHTHSFENRYRLKDDSYRVFSWNSTVDPLTGDVYAVARDMTDHRATEAQLRHAQKMEAVGQLAGGIAHDFNNLMQAVLANVELALEENGISPTLLDHLRDIEGAGRRAAELTKQLLVFSRRHPLHRQPLSLNELMLGFRKLLVRLLPENIGIDFRQDPRLPFVNADRTQLEQVLLNLCVNARDAMEKGGRLTIETDFVVFEEADCDLNPWARPGRFVRLSVTDTGVGMRPEVRERVFDPFFTTKEPQRGTGLGLATVYGIVQQHGGLIHVYSEEGQGTTFKVYLPADERTTAVASSAASASPPRSRGEETILIAEDEDFVRKPVVRLLERAGYRVLTAANGLEAIARFEAHHASIDLVLLDVVMPELGGPEAWERISANHPDARVLFTSGYADVHHRQRLPEGVTVLDKPFRTAELLERVRKKLDE